MATMLETLTEKYDYLMSFKDHRVDDYFMMSSPWVSLFICLFYVYVVCVAGPRFMENRQPYDIRKIMLVYNFAMVILSGYTCLEFGLSGWFVGYSFGCQPVDYSYSPQAMRMVNVCWLFYITKFIELLDTIFFIMRKKYAQITFLHVFHHGIMPVSWWFGVKFVAGGFGTFHAFLNSFIHFMMYTYYGLSAAGPAFQKFLWWKKYMTKMQIGQFILVCIHSAQLLFMDCNYPTLFVYWIASYALIFLIMFADFYQATYKQNQRLKLQKREAAENNNANGKAKKAD